MFWLAGPALAAIPQTNSTATTPADIPGQGRLAGQRLDQTTIGDARQPTVHVYRRGEHLTGAYGSFDVVTDWSRYALPPPPDNYHWVRFGANYLLVQSDTGVIADIVASG
jgi:Ni/Co efflux regulator RcnB